MGVDNDGRGKLSAQGGAMFFHLLAPAQRMFAEQVAICEKEIEGASPNEFLKRDNLCRML